MTPVSAASEERVGEIFARIAAVPSPSRCEREVADLVTRELQGLGLEVAEDGAGTAVGGTAGNVWCRVPGSTEKPVLALGAHLDTVEPTDRIEPVLRDGRFVNARGTILGADNKAAVAALLHATELVLASGELFPTFELIFTVAEEVGIQGAKHLSDRALTSPLAAVFDSAGPVGGVVLKAPGSQSLRATFRGKAAHAGLEPERGRNAIQAAARAVAAMQLGRIDEETTANVGVIEGGTAQNIVPDRCVIQAECRSHDPAKLARTAAAMVDACQKGAAESGADVDVTIVQEYRAFSLSRRSPAVRLCQAAFAELGISPRFVTTGGGSDANVFNARGIPTVNLDCGMARVHTPDEYVAVADLALLTRVIVTLVRLAPEYATRGC
ncbi:MAG: M20/M25/M40 family metallo-hydrolase [Thermoleophilia bacterium]